MFGTKAITIFLPDRNEWFGGIYEVRFFFFKKLLTFCLMPTEAGCKIWLANVWRNDLIGREPPDMYG